MFNPDNLLFFPAFLIPIIHLVYLRRLKNRPDYFSYTIYSIYLLFWIAFCIGELLSADLVVKATWRAAQVSLISIIPTAFIFFLTFTPSFRRSRITRYKNILIIFPIINFLFTWTNVYHQLVFSVNPTLNQNLTGFLLISHGLWSYISTVYALIIAIFCILIFIGQLDGFAKTSHRITCISLSIVPAALFLAGVAGYLPFSWQPVFALAASLCLGIIGELIFSTYSPLSLISIKDEIYNFTNDPSFLLDRDRNIIAINTRGKDLIPLKNPIGAPIRDFLPEINSLLLSPSIGEPVQSRVEIKNGSSITHYLLKSEVLGKNESVEGYLVSLQDISALVNQDKIIHSLENKYVTHAELVFHLANQTRTTNTLNDFIHSALMEISKIAPSAIIWALLKIDGAFSYINPREEPIPQLPICGTQPACRSCPHLEMVTNLAYSRQSVGPGCLVLTNQALSQANTLLVTTPIHCESKCLGYIFTANDNEQLNDDELKMLDISAAFIGSTADKFANKLEAENQRNYADSLQESGAIITSISDLPEVIDQFFARVKRFAFYNNALLVLLDDNNISALYEKSSGFNNKNQPDVIGHSISSLPLLFQNAIQTKQPSIIKEIAIELDSLEPFSISKSGSAMGIPMVFHDTTIGFLWVENTSGEPYNENQLSRINAFINQTVVAIQNARLYDEVALALKREERLNEIAYLISSANDLTDILKKVTRLAAELTGASASEIILLDANRIDFSPIILHNLPEYLVNHKFPKSGSLVGYTYDNSRPLIVNDYSTDPRAINDYIACGVKSALFIPVAASDTRLGVLALYSFTSEKAFNNRTAGFAQAIGQQTALTLQNARYLDSARKRAQEAETLREAAAAVASTLDQEEAFAAILLQLKRVVPYDSASIFILNDGKFDHLVGKGSNFELENAITNDGPGKEIIETHQPFIIQDIEKLSGIIGTGVQNNYKTWLGIPLLFQNELIGILSLSSASEKAFDQDHIRLASAFADQAAISIENVRLFQETKRLATTDGLTGVNNRRYFIEIASLEFERSKRYSRPLSVIMLDIDNFKHVNDEYGHASGDVVLKKVADVIQSSVRAVDIVGRYGGEEFAIFLPEILTNGARHVAERIRHKIADEDIEIDGGKIKITASLGVAGLDKSPITTLDKMLHRADLALYAAKRAGRNRVSL